VKDYENMLCSPLGVSTSVVPSPAPLSRKRLVDTVSSYASWEQKAQNMDLPLDLDLHLPAPKCIGEFNSNVFFQLLRAVETQQHQLAACIMRHMSSIFFSFEGHNWGITYHLLGELRHAH
jgi:hypothetical protein